MENTHQPDAFTEELAARVALHEVLLVQLFADRLLNRPNSAELLDGVGRAAETVMGSLGELVEGMDQAQTEFIRRQRNRGQELARNFFRKVASSRPAE